MHPHHGISESPVATRPREFMTTSPPASLIRAETLISVVNAGPHRDGQLGSGDQPVRPSRDVRRSHRQWPQPVKSLSAPVSRCAVVFNPIKVSDQFRSQVEKVLHRDGWAETLWLETSAEDPGRAMTREAVTAGAALVVAAGGDGTIRIVADGLAGSGIPMGVVPAGTGNLLARNLDLPMEEAAAIEVAIAGHTRTIDLIRLSVDNHPAEHFAVIAGVGVDAMIMDETDSGLKDKIGSAAYFVAAAKALKRLPVRLTVQVDNRRPVRRRAMICAIANVGELRGNLVLVPGALPDDGLLDVYIASPRRLRHWVKLGLRLITRRPQRDDQVDQLAGKRVKITIRGADNYQLDGDVVGAGTILTAQVRPAALTICVPRPDTTPDQRRIGPPVAP
jgi:diacylglycerol kinase (ATP)